MIVVGTDKVKGCQDYSLLLMMGIEDYRLGMHYQMFCLVISPPLL